MRLQSKRHCVRINRAGQARILHHLGIDLVAVFARLESDPREDHRFRQAERRPLAGTERHRSPSDPRRRIRGTPSDDRVQCCFSERAERARLRG